MARPGCRGNGGRNAGPAVAVVPRVEAATARPHAGSQHGTNHLELPSSGGGDATAGGTGSGADRRMAPLRSAAATARAPRPRPTPPADLSGAPRLFTPAAPPSAPARSCGAASISVGAPRREHRFVARKHTADQPCCCTPVCICAHLTVNQARIPASCTSHISKHARTPCSHQWRTKSNQLEHTSVRLEVQEVRRAALQSARRHHRNQTLRRPGRSWQRRFCADAVFFRGAARTGADGVLPAGKVDAMGWQRRLAITLSLWPYTVRPPLCPIPSLQSSPVCRAPNPVQGQHAHHLPRSVDTSSANPVASHAAAQASRGPAIRAPGDPCGIESSVEHPPCYLTAVQVPLATVYAAEYSMQVPFPRVALALPPATRGRPGSATCSTRDVHRSHPAQDCSVPLAR